MLIRCWGSRGSIPVSGPQYIKYGGDTTCIEIQTKTNEIIIIDAGSGIRALGNRLLHDTALNYSMLFTHGHWDHIMGFPFFKPLYNKQTHINVHGCPFTQNSLKDILAPSMSPPSFPIKMEDLQADISFQGTCAGSFKISSLEISTTLLSHPNQGLGFKIIEDGKAFVFLTDNELTYKHPGGLDFDDYREFCLDADVLFHDAEYTDDEYLKKRTWGHSTYKDSLRLAIASRVRQFGLFHHNQDRSDKDIDEIVNDCRQTLKLQGAHLECFAVAQGMEIRL